MFKKIWNLLSSVERRKALVLLILMIFGMIMETIGVGLVVPTLGLLSYQFDSPNFATYSKLLNILGNPNQQTVVIGAMLLLVSVYIIKTIFLGFLVWKQNSFVFGVQADLSQRLFRIYLDQSYTFHLMRNSSELIRNVFGEVNIFAGSGVMSAIILVTELMVIIGLCALLTYTEPIGAFLTLGVLGLAAFLFIKITRKRITRWGKERHLHEGGRIQHLQQGLGGVKDVKILGREVEFLEQYKFHNYESSRAGMLQNTLQQLPRLWLELLAVIGLTIVVMSMIVQGREIKEVLPTIGMFAAAAFRLMPSINRVLGAIQSLRFSYPVIEMMNKELNLSSYNIVKEEKKLIKFENSIKLNNISYSYPSVNKPVIQEISIEIKKGESIGLIGTSGSGKSTLVDLILGLIQPNKGTIKIDNYNLQENLRGWQNQIGYVPQSIYLTDDSLMRNIAFGVSNNNIDKLAVKRAIRAVLLEDFVESLPNGLETFVGERGVKLSGGQLQRIGIARALYHDPNVLVLDEATSALDKNTEDYVMSAVKKQKGLKTIIIIAHRLSTIELCDKIYKIENGKLIIVR